MKNLNNFNIHKKALQVVKNVLVVCGKVCAGSERNHRPSRGGWRRQAAKNTGGKEHEAGVSFSDLLVIYIMFTDILTHLINVKLRRMV